MNVDRFPLYAHYLNVCFAFVVVSDPLSDNEKVPRSLGHLNIPIQFGVLVKGKKEKNRGNKKESVRVRKKDADRDDRKRACM